MRSKQQAGADVLVRVLEDAGVEVVFGLPGTQNIPLFDALRRSSIRTVLATSETAAGFMAIGYYRATGRPGVFAGIPGPGFAFALPALAEAALDSSAVLFITGDRVERGKRFDHQAIDQDRIADAICGANFHVEKPGDVAVMTDSAITATTRAGCRPVVLQVASAALQGHCSAPSANEVIPGDSAETMLPGDLVELLGNCRKPMVIAGTGALDCAEEVADFATSLGALVITTPAARGVVPEQDSRVLPVDLLCDDTDALNTLVEKCDLVIALGCRFTHNTTGGFSLRLPEDRLVHVHEDPDVLNANYAARWALNSSTAGFLQSAGHAVNARDSTVAGYWTPAHVQPWRNEILRRSPDAQFEPAWPPGAVGCEAIFEELRSALPDDAIVVTDTGMHQIVTRKYYEVRSPRGLIVPTDFQSMGFGLPAAIGAALACPDRSVFAVVGDGTLMMMLAELSTIATEKLPVVVIVFADGWLGQIRAQQVEWGGKEFSTKLGVPDLEHLAGSFDLGFRRCTGEIESAVSASLDCDMPTLIELPLDEPPELAHLKAKQYRKDRLKRVLGPAGIKLVKRLSGRA